MIESINSFAETMAAFIFVLGVLIFVHELGHHLVAKWLGIRVETFSLGFGPRLLGFRMGGTDYRVSLLPLGGYVKMAGENISDDCTGSPDEFRSKSKFSRFLVLLAGPVMNIGLAIVIFAAAYMVGVQVPRYLQEPAVIGAIMRDSPASQAGLQVGDRILAIADRSIENWEDAELQVATRGNQDVEMTLERSGRTIRQRVRIEGRGTSDQGYLGAHAHEPFLIDALDDGFPAQDAGLLQGDLIVEARLGDDERTGFWAIYDLVSHLDGEEIELTVERDEETFAVDLVPVRRKTETFDGESEYRSFIGVRRSRPTITEQFGFFESFQRSVERNYQIASLLFQIVGGMVTGKVSINNLGGPIEIARVSGAAAQQGAASLVSLIAFISLQLGILNLLPIPILDGGRIVVLGVEGLMRRDLSLRAQEVIMHVGLLILVLLMSFVILNDIRKLL